MPSISIPPTIVGTAATISDFLTRITEWHTKHKMDDRPDKHRLVWYRGHADRSWQLTPGVYRPGFTGVLNMSYGNGTELRRLNLEREMLSEFRTSGASLLNTEALQEVYFIAQHRGMPTRLLDWSTNPLAALFFAVHEPKHTADDGEIFAMEASKLLPSPSSSPLPPPPSPPATPPIPDPPTSIATMRHPYVSEAIGLSFWNPKTQRLAPLILPVRPDHNLGRIRQQSSCFTLHMHESSNSPNPTLERISISAGAKPDLLKELRRLNTNEWSIYGDLDHLSSEIKSSRGL